MSTHDHTCIVSLRAPDHPNQICRCYCGQGWKVATANDVFTGGPILIWARISRWNLLARRRLARQARSTG